MARGELTYFSDALCREVSFRFIVPNDIAEKKTEDNPYFRRPTKTLLLLHGYNGMNSDWMLHSNILELSEKYNIAVVCPSGENSFYLDGRESGRAFATFVGKELMDYVHKTFGLSPKKEDNFAGGLSMGGFGALHTVLQFPERFFGAFGLSSAMIQYEVTELAPDIDNGIANYDYYRMIWGDLSDIEHSISNPDELVRRIQAAGGTVPKLYMAMGTEDNLLKNHRRFHEFLVERNVDVRYIETEGRHDYDFWSRNLEPAIRYFMPL